MLMADVAQAAVIVVRYAVCQGSPGDRQYINIKPLWLVPCGVGEIINYGK